MESNLQNIIDEAQDIQNLEESNTSSKSSVIQSYMEMTKKVPSILLDSSEKRLSKHYSLILSYIDPLMKLRPVCVEFNKQILLLREQRKNFLSIPKKKKTRGSSKGSNDSYSSNSSAGSDNSANKFVNISDEIKKLAETFYTNIFREMMIGNKVGKKNLAQFMEENMKQNDKQTIHEQLGAEVYNEGRIKKQLVNIKKNVHINKQDQITAKLTIFDLPSLIFSSANIDHFYFLEDEKDKKKGGQALARKHISFHEYAKNRHNFEYLKEFNNLNDNQPNVNILNSKTGDVISIYKGFLVDLFDDNDEEGEIDNYEFLMNDKDLAAELCDFTDPSALRRRQQRILDKINKHKSSTTFDPLRILRNSTLTWMLILCHGGKFVLQVYENDKMIVNKTDSKYVIRGKQGGRQLNADKSKTIKSLGSSMRRANEKMLQQNIEDFMEESRAHIKASHIIFLHAPGFNKTLFMSQSKSLQQYAHKVKSIAFNSNKANFQESKELVAKIIEVKIHFDINKK